MTYPHIDPVIFSLGPLAVRWYGVMYLLGFLFGWILVRYLINRRNHPMTPEQLSDLLFWIVFGVVLGGRFGYVLFYNFSWYIHHPLDIVKIWQGGDEFPWRPLRCHHCYLDLCYPT